MGGAKNCPETPRQKMIGMMYLVLTAMLALNVSTDILNGFRLVDDSLHYTLDAYEVQIQNQTNEFRLAAEDNEQKNGEWYQRALELNQKSDSIYNYIEDFKAQIALLADGKDFQKKLDEHPKIGARVANISARDQLDVTAQYAINEGHGAELKEMFINYRNYLIELSNGTKRREFEQMFSVAGGTNHDGDSISWEEVIFEGMPVGASVTVLSKMQLDIRSAQSEMILFLRDQTDAGDIRANKLEAFVVPNSRYVMRGGKYTAKIVLAAVDSTARPEYYVNGKRIDDDGIYEVIASGTGTTKYTGELVIPATVAGEEPRHIRFESDYTVGEPSVTIANTELDVIYSDYDNKYSISVPGVSADKVTIQVQGATAKYSQGLWILRVNGDKTKKVVIDVLAELDGKRQSMGKQEFRVKALPEPSVYFMVNGSPVLDDKISKKDLRDANSFFEASYGEDGVLRCPYKVKSFRTYINGQLQEASSSPKFSKQMLDMISNMKAKQPLIITDIRFVTDEGKERKYKGGITYFIK